MTANTNPLLDFSGLPRFDEFRPEHVTPAVDALLADARRRIERVDARAAWASSRSGEALIVDIRSDDDRRRDGIVPGSLHIPRTVLEWRVDPESAWANPHVGDRSRRLLLLCTHGFSSSLAAASLVELGFERAGDIEGGFEGWRAAGLPVVPAPAPVDHGLAGMGPPDRACSSEPVRLRLTD
jgi:rhodanese-related sulfurtransferase